ncbi:SpoIIE family protein phosphatase [Cellulomonas massiliensis]|uniref:SpoIIE family protein phosphatase n=1 Tax=Cellulomonas massiliensis TaxID=1465811 RepID=UPI0002E06FA7|nr:SpoIIE family protein phosphatase [Cellulomonas massiliensis]
MAATSGRVADSDDAVLPAPAGAPETMAAQADRVRWQLAVTAGGVGTFDWDLLTGRLDWDDLLLELFGLERHAFGGTIEAFNAALHPDDIPRVTDALRDAVATCSAYVAEYRVVRPDGTVRWVKARGVALPGPDGRAQRVLGAAYDTTVEREGDARVQRLLETMTNAFFLLDRDWRFALLNTAAEKMLQAPRAELLGRVVWDAFPAAKDSPFEEQYTGAVRDGHARAFEAYYPAPLERWYDVRAWPGPDGLSVFFDDVTARRAAEHEARSARASAEAASRRLSILGALGDDLSSTLETEEAVARLARHLVPAFGSWCLITLSEDQRHLRDIGSWHADARLRATVERYAALRIDSLAPTSYLFEALRTGRLVPVPDATESITSVLSGHARDVLHELAPRTAYAVPLRARNRTVGAMTLFLDADHPDLDDDDLGLLVQLADRAGLALDNARLYQRQREIAVTLQRSLLSSPAQPAGLDVVVRYVAAAEVAQVGGDWYDSFVQPSGAPMLVIGDVMGHDTPAAASMSQLRTLLRGVAQTAVTSPAQTLTALDTAAVALSVDAMATAVVARLEDADPADGGARRLVWSNAGHLPPVLLLPDGGVEELVGEGPGLVLGLDPRAPRSDSSRPVPPGSVVLLYTDGLVERRGEHLRTGIERLLATVRDAARGGVRSRGDLDALVDEVLARLSSPEPGDDVAVLAFRLADEADA